MYTPNKIYVFEGGEKNPGNAEGIVESDFAPEDDWIIATLKTDDGGLHGLILEQELVEIPPPISIRRYANPSLWGGLPIPVQAEGSLSSFPPLYGRLQSPFCSVFGSRLLTKAERKLAMTEGVECGILHCEWKSPRCYSFDSATAILRSHMINVM